MKRGGDSRPVVLLAEDERGLADIFAAWLSDGYEVRVAYDGETAIELYDKSVDVALLDRHMPWSSGDDVVDYIRSRDSDCAVAMVTAIAPDIDVFEIGFDEYIVKPISEAELRDLVERLLQRMEYDADLRRHYQLTSKIALLETHLEPAELDGSEEYLQLLEEREALDVSLTASVGQLSSEDVGSLLRGGPSDS